MKELIHKKYLDGWISFCLFIRDIEKNKFTDEQAKLYLIDLLKNNYFKNYKIN